MLFVINRRSLNIGLVCFLRRGENSQMNLFSINKYLRGIFPRLLLMLTNALKAHLIVGLRTAVAHILDFCHMPKIGNAVV